jgi:hypothetical protein
MVAFAMSSLTPFPSAILLFALAYPPALVEFTRGFLGGLAGAGRRTTIWGQPPTVLELTLAYVVPLILAIAVAPDLMRFRLASLYWHAIGLLAGPVIMVSEMALGAILAGHVRNLRKVRFVVHPYWSRLPAWMLALSVGLVVAEELTFRQAWLSILSGPLGLSASLGVLVAAVAYALNHISFGLRSLPQKLLAGIAYGLLFVGSGGAVLVPVLAHFGQNLCLALLGRR